MKPNKTFILTEFLFLIIGVGLLVGSVFAWKNIRHFIDTSLTTTGTVISLDYSSSTNQTKGVYYPIVNFTTRDGKEITFMSAVGSNPSSFQEGNEVTVLYNPNKPNNASIKDFFSLWLLPFVLMFLGVGFTMLGIVLLLMISILPQRRKKYLLKRGQKIITDFMGIEINGSLAVNGRHPYTLSSQWLDPNTNKIYIFKSENIWFNPENYITNKKIEVLIDPKNYDKYYMNISFLPEGG